MIISGPNSRWRLDIQGNLYREDGYVGIGTDSPIGLLTLNSAIINVDNSGRLVFTDSTGSYTFESFLTDPGLNQTVQEHYNQHSSAIQTVIKDLDGYSNLQSLPAKILSFPDGDDFQLCWDDNGNIMLFE